MQTITLLNIFNQPYEKKGTVIGEKIYGYNSPSGGSWSPYQDKEKTWTPATFILFRYYRRKKISAINKNRVVSIR